jgi:hypothetical protein
VHVTVDEPRTQHLVAQIDGAGHAPRARDDLGDAFTVEQHGGFFEATGRDDAGAVQT